MRYGELIGAGGTPPGQQVDQINTRGDVRMTPDPCPVQWPLGVRYQSSFDSQHSWHLLQATNRLAAAEPLMRRALAIDEKSFGPDHPDVAAALNNLAQRSLHRGLGAADLLRRL
jgi:hypothetical protein